MFKISTVEKWILALTGAFLLLTVGYFLVSNAGEEEYSIKGQTIWTSEVGETGQSTPSEGKVNINTADEALLQTLPGIGPVLAEKIVEDRRVIGAFRIPEDLVRVSGIGEATLNKLMDHITVG